MEPPHPRAAISLDGAWSFCLSADRPLDGVRTIADVEALRLPIRHATVPGNLELDMLAEGAIPDPFVGMNMAAMRRFETCGAAYFRRFDARPSDGVDYVLEAEGVDCYARIYLNGALVATCDNMLTEWRADLPAGLLRDPSLGAPGSDHRNEIVVVFDPPIGRDRRAEYPRLLQAMAANYESLHTRKAPHMYGWDIMPRALSMGLWRPIRILELPRERIGETYMETLALAPDRAWADVQLHYALRLERHPLDPDPSRETTLRIEGACGEATFREERRILGEAGTIRFRLADPMVWWPRGRGRQSLYDCQVTLLRAGAVLDRTEFSFGVRTIELDRTDTTDETGRGEFCFMVNGERLFVLGTNWVPLDAYHSRDIERVDQAVALVEEIGCNMIRCWGGNVYESDRFFDLCDRAGILVWQDFAMACAIHPQDLAFQETLRREATQVVRRLRQHPCVALWAGDNECDMSFLWGGSGTDPNTNALTRRVLPEVVRCEDPRRPYLPSSPYIAPDAMAKGLQYLPEDHLWGPRDYYKGPYYTSSLCHFASEIGYHGCPSPESVRRFITPGKEWPYTDNDEWLLHSTSPIPGVDLFDYRVELMAKQVRVLFGAVPDGLEDFAYASQCSQAEAMKFFVEMFRSQKWRRTG
ncbi:MAG: glycoside hydrolase family 2, partial [Armatimonadetes bacterium]|nr:glycoside hydrolase family 2 [Armatimonadota bacterium]